MTCDLLYRYSGITQYTIGQYLGIDYSSVNKLRYRLRKRLEHDDDLMRQYNVIVATINKYLSNV